jgi:hypothetical protein
MSPDWFIEEVPNAGVSCERTDCFEQATWFIEGNYYCGNCKDYIIKILEEL